MQATRLAWALLLLATLSSGTSVIEQPAKPRGADSGLFRISRNGLWGFMDRTGRIAIPPKFENVSDFFGSLASFRRKGKEGFINSLGEIVISARFDQVGSFTGTIAPVRIGRKWGYIDRTGKLLVPPSFQRAANMHDGLARIFHWSRATCWVPTSPSGYKIAQRTSEDAPLYAFDSAENALPGSPNCSPEDGVFGFLNENGQVVIPAQFPYARDFSEGRAVIATKRKVAEYGFIDQTGKIVIAPKFIWVDDFHEGVAAVDLKGSVRGNSIVDTAISFVDRQGAVVIAGPFEKAGQFSEGLAAVVRPEAHRSESVYIDTAGRTILKGGFGIARPFRNGFANVGFELIDRTGKRVLITGDVDTEFSEGLAVVERKGKLFYVDASGREIARYR